MKEEIRTPIRHMLQGLAHWMAYRSELSNIQLIEADTILLATDILRANLSKDFVVEREISHKSLHIIDGKRRIDLGIKTRNNDSYICLIEFKLADATNKGYIEDVEKLNDIKSLNKDIDCLVVIIYRKSCSFDKLGEFINVSNGTAKRKKCEIPSKGIYIKVRGVYNSFTSKNRNVSKKTICLEII